MKAHKTATMTDGNMFDTLMFFSHTILIPSVAMSTEPTRLSAFIASAVITGLIRLASTVTTPCTRRTGMNEKTAPFPLIASLAI